MIIQIDVLEFILVTLETSMQATVTCRKLEVLLFLLSPCQALYRGCINNDMCLCLAVNMLLAQYKENSTTESNHTWHPCSQLCPKVKVTGQKHLLTGFRDYSITEDYQAWYTSIPLKEEHNYAPLIFRDKGQCQLSKFLDGMIQRKPGTN